MVRLAFEKKDETPLNHVELRQWINVLLGATTRSSPYSFSILAIFTAWPIVRGKVSRRGASNRLSVGVDRRAPRGKLVSFDQVHSGIPQPKRGAHSPPIVVENACGESFTYQINGSEAEYLGAGDLHDLQ
jgi:hypothetical protein